MMNSPSDRRHPRPGLLTVEYVDKVCDKFEAAWPAKGSNSPRPRIEDFLGDLPEPGRSQLLRELLRLELAYRRDAGERPTVEEYKRRFPEHAALLSSWSVKRLSFVPSAGQTTPPQGPNIPGYEILEELGRGGMGIVYKARQTKLNRLVALKMILSGELAGEQELARFRVEAEAVARLQHPHIVQIHEIGETSTGPFFSLEFVEGGSLDKEIDGTPLPGRQAAQLVETLAWAMHAAHEQGIVHRDLKPQNVMLTATGEPKITDFGLAKKLDEAKGQTQSGAIVGTPSYMAPEQARSKKQVGPAADIYALGAILYELLTGRPPFRAETPLDTLLQVLEQEPVRPSVLQPRLDRDLETICLKCLEKQSDKRYPTAAALAEDLRRFQASEPILARRTGALRRAWKWAKRRPAVAALVTVLALLLMTAGTLLVRDGVHRQALEEDIGLALAEGERTHKEFGEVLVGFDDATKKNRRIFELQRQSEIDAWQKRLRQARTNWEKANDLAAANPRLVDPVLAGRIQILGQKLQVDETGLVLAKELGKHHSRFPQALGAAYCNRGDIVLFKQDNPKAALEYYERVIQILQGPGSSSTVGPWSGDVLDQAKRGREAASFLLQGFTGALSHFPATTLGGTLRVQQEVVRFGMGDVDVWRRVGPGEVKLVGLRFTVPSDVRELNMQVGRVYLINLESREFYAKLRVKDALGKVLAAYKMIGPLNLQLIFTPKKDGIYRIEVGSVLDRGLRPECGQYRLTISAVASGK
jgi:tRNA A-37 threonylcarbamoyl transferase component Bud32